MQLNIFNQVILKYRKRNKVYDRSFLSKHEAMQKAFYIFHVDSGYPVSIVVGNRVIKSRTIFRYWEEYGFEDSYI